MGDATVANSLVLAFLARAVPSGSARDRTLAEVGLDQGSLAVPDARLRYDVALRLFEAAIEESQDDAFGLHFAEQLDASALGVVGYFVAASDTLETGLRRVLAYHRLVKDAGAMDLVVQDAELTITEQPTVGSQWPRHLAESTLATYLTLGRTFTGHSIRAHRATFQHARPASTDEHVRVLGCVPAFGCSTNSVTVDASVMKLPMLGGDAALSRYLQMTADAQLAALPRASALMSDVERVILAALPEGIPTIHRIARSLGMGPRTLQRRLAERGRPFQQIVDDVRRQVAPRLLDDERLTVSEVAFLLGFSDASGFQRAHRRWTGHSPRGRGDSESSHSFD